MEDRIDFPRNPDGAALAGLLPRLLDAREAVIDAASGVARRSEASAAAPFELAGTVITVVLGPDRRLPRELAETVARAGLPLRATRRLSPPGAALRAFELYLDVAGRDEAIRGELADLADRWQIDIALTPADVKRPRRRLIAFDMDSTLIRCEVIDELAFRAGVGDEVAAVTERAMRGELDFKSSFRARMAKLRGLSDGVLAEIAAELPIMDGAAALLMTLRGAGHRTVILSGGFDYFAERVRAELGIDALHANHLQIRDGALTGEVDGPIVDGERKVELLRRVAAQAGLDMTDTVAVGDGANDLPMLDAAGLGVAFHAKPLVRRRAQCAMNHCDLRGLAFLLGMEEAGPDAVASA